ncbi:MAG TPA: HAMP domain-containing sensor histidine kinase [Gammaproteobacteria bacterium]|nr:HAMP domain-containing sensor histidine kinase [Gammaproteobacteria bacterium]
MYRPRSISRLVLFGIAVVLTPLLAAIITAVVQVDRLAQRNRVTVLEARLATEQSRALVEQLTAMERALGQYQVRGDRDFYGIYLERRAIFRTALDNLDDFELRTVGGDELAEIDAREQALFDELGGAEGVLQPGVSWEEVTANLASLDETARRVLAASSQLIESQADDAIDSAEQVQRILLSLSAAAIVMTTLLAALFFVTINRPMNELGDAIRRLGARDFGEPISVRGPQDVEALGEQLDWLRRRIVELETQKTTFLQHISHELKTPLTTIREGAELLAESLNDEAPEEAEVSQIMRTSSLYLQRLIEDLLQFARTQDPVIDLELRDGIELRQLVRSLLSAQAVAVAAKDIVVEQNLEDVRVRGDEKKLQIILDNLLTNAIKYTPDGGFIRVSLRAGDSYAVLDVLDSGPGIDPAEAEIIFEPFQQGAAEHQSSVKGTGLGLSIAREYVEAHDGFIKVIPSDRGAHLQVAVPIAGPAGLAPA